MQNALITGATKGIGLAIAKALAKEGINLAICSRNNEDLLLVKEALLQINSNIRVFTRVTDCSLRKELISFAAEAERELQSIQILINNAGLFLPASILEEEENALQKQLDLNLMAGYELYRYFGKKLIAARTGHIFNICSVAAKQVVVNAGSYSVTKFAQRGLNDVMREEMKAHRVKVTAILPGSTLTSSWSGTTIPPEKFVMPEDVAAAVINCLKMSAGANVDELIIQTTTEEI
ncbi:SDR family oxidoreductase [Mucilaginibacter arboris]|uniref:SDR family NAD(P)-dependent oxidoreductase n=1 Tax=Mucilaginibacter arboris TaxID=2682090 RepID=A0A7K1SUM8_9SPHI|nr:SDR family oxidoreductase [Mucilaginibacter arboris]MVN20967.1 SDR family NAD(P)-dependent oxidoreductase [Mucilaginibacter arboris]